jgi:hypothetical protein
MAHPGTAPEKGNDSFGKGLFSLSVRSLAATAASVACLTPFSSFAQQGENVKTVWVVVGHTMMDSKERELSNYFDDKPAADKWIKDVMYDNYDPTGDLYGSVDKPQNLHPLRKRVATFDKPTDVPPKGPPPSPELRRKPSVAPAMQKSQSESPLKLNGKWFRGTIGRANAIVKFNERTFNVIGDIQDQGKWESTPTGVIMTTSTSRYRGVIQGDKLVGMRFFKNNRPAEQWSLKRSDSSP